MAETKDYAAGTFCWIELATTDTTVAKKFYTELMGWQTEDSPMPDGTTYTMLRLGNDDLGGAYTLTQEMIAMHAPPHWSCHIAVKDAAATVKKARELGGTIQRDAFDVMDLGRMAVITDVTGATFCVWQAGKHRGAAHIPMGTPGAVSWYEVMTPNVDRVATFYSKLLGWKPTPMDMGGMPYTVFMLGDQQLGGAMEMPKEMQQQKVPPHWMVYFGVGSCDATLATARKLGARVVAGPMDIPTVGRVATLVDAQGVAFSVHQPAPR